MNSYYSRGDDYNAVAAATSGALTSGALWEFETAAVVLSTKKTAYDTKLAVAPVTAGSAAELVTATAELKTAIQTLKNKKENLDRKIDDYKATVYSVLSGSDFAEKDAGKMDWTWIIIAVIAVYFISMKKNRR